MKPDSFWTFNEDYDAYGTGFATFGKEHLITLGCIAVIVTIACVFYRRSTGPVRKIFLRVWAIVPLTIECVTQIALVVTVHPYPVHELPFQICNLFMVVGVFHAFKPTKLTGELLYSLGLISPILSLLTPDWTRFPFFSYWVFQDFTYHCFLVGTPLVLLFGKDLRPNFKNLGKVTIFILGFFAADAVLNTILGTNFVFLSYPAKGTFLETLDNWFNFLGKRGYLLGMLLVDITVWTIEYLPWVLVDLQKKKNSEGENMKEAKTEGLWKIKAGLSIVGSKQLRELNKVSKNGKAAQEKTLRALLEYGKDTVYGKEHHFAGILNAATGDELFASYAKNVPVNVYEDLKPYIERHKKGEADVLFPGKPKMYATTSGTTAEPKWIPITEKYFSDVYQKMNQLWFYTAYQARPHVFDGPTVSIVGKAVEGAASDGTVYGSISGIAQRDIPKFMQPLHAAPADVFHITDYKARYYAIMRMGIARDTRWIITANPSTLIEMQNNANEFYDDYIDDIEHGTVSTKFDIPDDIRKAMLSHIKPNPARAQELRDLRTKYGTVLPKHYWPNLQVINTWMCGNTNVYFQKVKDSFPENTLFFEFAYYASECKAGNIINPKTKDTVLFAHKVFFEFVHEADYGTKNPKVYQMHELTQGERYNIIVSTSSGLYRYSMNDIVQVSGYYNDFPTIQFIQKANGIISMTGEKLHERQFIDAVRKVEKETGGFLRFFVCFADVQKSLYRFYYEFADPTVSKEDAENFTKLVDSEMKVLNEEYKEKRNSFRVKDPETELLVSDSFETFKARCIDMGYRDGQFKLNLLMQDEKREAMFEELVKAS